jgi:hypothetical protein
MKNISLRVLPLILVLGLRAASPASVLLQASPAQEESFKLAVQAYTENRFTDARTLFESVGGAHAEEAKKYLSDIKSYKDALEEANGVLSRSASELDVKSLDFAISRYEQALTIKKDGPWQPQQQLEKARALKARLLPQEHESTDARDHDFCQKALQAAKARQYKQAALFSCPLANDNPAYSCGGDEAVHMCQEMGELAKLNPRPDAAASSDHTAAAGDFGKGSAAYETNDFAGARSWFERVEGSEKSGAADYVQRISRYTASLQQAEAARKESRYDDARVAYQQAAAIKSDGPGNPQQQAFLIDLRRGIEEFYSGNYGQADSYLEAYQRESTERRDLVHFYRGACKLASFFLQGSRDNGLREQALNDFRLAKRAGFAGKDQEVSPKILQAYNEISVSP